MFGSDDRRRLPMLLALAASLLLAGACAPREAPATAPETPATLAPRAFTAWPDSVLYFVVLDRFADGDPSNNADVDRFAKGTFHGGDLAGLTARIAEIADLGVTALWITPVVRNIPGYVTGAGFPDWGYHGYWADDFRSLDPRFGTEAELRALVDACHRRGIRVLLDVVYNHAGYDSRYLKDPETRGWFRTEALGTCGSDDLTSCVAGLPDFKTERDDVADYLMDAHLELARRVGLDGFRLDTVKHVDHPFWQEHRKRTRSEVAPGFFLVGEVWGGDAASLDPWFAGDEMDAGFDFSFQGSTLGWVQGRGRTVAYDRYLKSREKVRPGYLLAHFLSSHDVPGALKQLDGDTGRFLLAAILQLTTAGLPTIYYGEEVGRLGGDWPDNRSDMPWGDRKIEPGAGDPRNERLREAYRKLIGIRRDHPALARGSHLSVSSDGDLLVFGRVLDGAGTVYVAVNRGDAPQRATIPVGAGGPTAWRDLWNDRDVSLRDGTIELEIGGRAAAIVGVASR